MNQPPPSPGSTGSALPRLTAQSLGAIALWVFAQGLKHLPCWGIWVPATLLAWPLWVYRGEAALFGRRMALAYLTREDSGLRRRLSPGTLTLFWQAVVSLLMALLLLFLAASLDALHWAVLALDVLLLSLVVNPLQRTFSGQISSDRLGFFTRRWPLLGLNLTLLTLSFAACFDAR